MAGRRGAPATEDSRSQCENLWHELVMLCFFQRVAVRGRLLCVLFRGLPTGCAELGGSSPGRCLSLSATT